MIMAEPTIGSYLTNESCLFYVQCTHVLYYYSQLLIVLFLKTAL